MMRSVVFIAALLVFSACDSPAKIKTDKESIAEIEKMEKGLFSSMETPDDSLADALMSAYEGFSANFPENEMAPEFLFRSANVARSFNDYKRALGHYERIVAEHPDFENIIETKFLIAFMYDNDFKDKQKAEELYTSISQEYPNHLFGKQAKQRLETLHMSDSDMLEYFKKKNGLSKEPLTEE